MKFGHKLVQYMTNTCSLIKRKIFKRPKAYQNCFLINYSWLVIKKGLDLGPYFPNHTECFLKIFPMTMSISWSSCMLKWSTIQKIYSSALPHVLIIIMASQLSKLIQWLKIWKTEYLKNETWLFHEVKSFLNWGSKTTLPLSFFSRDNLWCKTIHCTDVRENEIWIWDVARVPLPIIFIIVQDDTKISGIRKSDPGKLGLTFY